MQKSARFISMEDMKDCDDTKKRSRQENIHSATHEQKTQELYQLVAQWVYKCGIPFDAVDNDTFKELCEAVGQFGPGFEPPSQYHLRVSLLRETVDVTKKLPKKQEDEWSVTGCSILIDTWTDRKGRTIMNMYVNCRYGTTFVSFEETFGKGIFRYVDQLINQIGPEKIVQVVSDNNTNKLAAKALFIKKRPHIFWTSCATHTINLMLVGIGMKYVFKNIINRARSLTIFIYSHHNALAMMRKFTSKRDIVKPGVTRFATSFLTLQALVKNKQELKWMFVSNEWEESKWSRTEEGKQLRDMVLSFDFWSDVTRYLKVFAPLVKVLRLVDDDRKPSMGFLYGELKQARVDMRAAFKPSETGFYKKVMDIIDERGKGRVDTSLHLAAYLLNPFYHYKDASVLDEEEEKKIFNGFVDCVKYFFPGDVELQDQIINVELKKYRNKEGLFGKPLAINSITIQSYDPVQWWDIYGSGMHTKNLQRMAMRILALTSSTSGCKRNSSTFEEVHIKKKKKLDTSILNNLAYVQFNARLLNKNRQNKERDVLLANDATNVQAWIVEDVDEEEVEPEFSWKAVSKARSPRYVRELDDDDFESDDEDFELDDEVSLNEEAVEPDDD